jgi:hypothetical protein
MVLPAPVADAPEQGRRRGGGGAASTAGSVSAKATRESQLLPWLHIGGLNAASEPHRSRTDGEAFSPNAWPCNGRCVLRYVLLQLRAVGASGVGAELLDSVERYRAAAEPAGLAVLKPDQPDTPADA